MFFAHNKNMKQLKVTLSAIFAIIICFSCIYFVGCKSDTIKMYNTNTGKIEKLKLEDYVAGVCTAEMGESFAVSAIEAQSVIARSYALWFKNNSKSKYPGADISNDITEAQAYTSEVPQKVKDACKRTKGKVLKYNNNIILPYYCANCGGNSSLATDVFINNTSDYLSSVETFETSENSKNYTWTASLLKSEILFAMQKLGKNLSNVNTFKVGKVDDAGRALTFVIGGITVNANQFRLNIGSTIVKSCKISDIQILTDKINISGVGYGHGVGFSQWGANVMANNNKTYDQILNHFFPKCKLAEA